MRKTTNFGKSMMLAVFASLSTMMITSCNKNEETVLPQQLANEKAVSTSTTGENFVTLFAGQTINVGQLQFDQNNVTEELTVTYALTGGWELVEIHFSIGSTFSSIPMNKSGNPIPGQFGYKPLGVLGLSTYTITIPYSAIGFTCPGPATYYIAAHASVRKSNGSGGYQTETAWGDGNRISQRGSWAESFTITITCDEDPDPEEYETSSETGFAYNATYSDCFLTNGFNRWGWTNGPLAPGTYTFDLYAGAGQCDLSKGILTGTVVLVYNVNGTATVSYQTANNSFGDPYTLEEVQVYIGSGMFPVKNGEATVAPGQYGYDYDLTAATSHTLTVNGLSGDIYFIAHAVVTNIPL